MPQLSTWGGHVGWGGASVSRVAASVDERDDVSRSPVPFAVVKLAWRSGDTVYSREAPLL
jgi:hypothetical protein